MLRVSRASCPCVYRSHGQDAQDARDTGHLESMRIVAAILSVLVIALVLTDAFELMLQPRRVMHRFRFARLFYRNFWWVWRTVALAIQPGKRREAFLSIFGPLSLLALFEAWVFGLVLGFAVLDWSLRVLEPVGEHASFLSYIYLSGATFFTVGYGEIGAAARLARVLVMAEAGLGLGFLAVVISYLPILYQAFSRRETVISLLDARAGSPPSASQLLLRIGRAGQMETLNRFLAEWEVWAAELLESHLSFPVLSYYRSQHDNQSWLAALTTMLDNCAVLLVEVEGENTYQAQLTFAIARHAAVDLALVLKTPPKDKPRDRLSPEARKKLCEQLREAGLELCPDETENKLAELRAMYEPFVEGLAERFLFRLPEIVAEEPAVDNWQRSAWMKRTPGIGQLPAGQRDDEHF